MLSWWGMIILLGCDSWEGVPKKHTPNKSESKSIHFSCEVPPWFLDISKVCISWQHRHLTRRIWGAFFWVKDGLKTKKMGAVFWMTCKHNCQKSSLWEGFWMDFIVFPPLFDRLCDDTPLKINKEAKIITPIEKDNHHPVASILGFNMSIFHGLVTFFFQKWSWCSSGGACRPAGHGPFPESVCHVGKPIKVDPVDLQLTHQGLGIIRNDTVLIYENKSSYNTITMNCFFYNKIWLKIFLDLSTFDFVGFDDSFKLHGSVTQSLVDFLRRNVVSWQTNPLEDGARLGWFFPLAGGFLVFFEKNTTRLVPQNLGEGIRGVHVYVHMYISYKNTSYIRINIYIYVFRTTFLNSTPKKGGFSSPFWKIPDHGIPSDS